MSTKITVKAIITRHNGPHHSTEDRVDMEVHDFHDYLTMKYIARGSKIYALPARLTNEISREAERIKKDGAL